MKTLRLALAASLCLALATSLSGCGFQLRGSQDLAFQTIAVPGATPLRAQLKRALENGSNATLVEDTKNAEAVLNILRESQEKVILSLNTRGRVREYQLRYSVSYKVSRTAGGFYIPPTTVVLTRDLTYNDEILAKESEEAELYADMRADFAQQLLRRLAAAKPITEGI